MHNVVEKDSERRQAIRDVAYVEACGREAMKQEKAEQRIAGILPVKDREIQYASEDLARSLSHTQQGSRRSLDNAQRSSTATRAMLWPQMDSESAKANTVTRLELQACTHISSSSPSPNSKHTANATPSAEYRTRTCSAVRLDGKMNVKFGRGDGSPIFDTPLPGDTTGRRRASIDVAYSPRGTSMLQRQNLSAGYQSFVPPALPKDAIDLFPMYSTIKEAPPISPQEAARAAASKLAMQSKPRGNALNMVRQRRSSMPAVVSQADTLFTQDEILKRLQRWEVKKDIADTSQTTVATQLRY
ncbi:hypothetical protein CEUSTIGMA_g12756.t1 [Chlamydomonas eustigma]|uniref:Uncharacterized protein n=1 Tax=Chlamydomonas eustigma TaxID=1157962 RepID=A0A250XQV9_9CHLO|nr:hypothetical protein CEUSTIGMA_g12756.t1 [Chlamydomonas eustigma]|eukprot:GAX85339.1 hypothetical protein CEUSTIGMA_g12756.t1 [Chlamydomonas eustigma]